MIINSQKRFVALVLAIVMVFLTFPIMTLNVFAATEVTPVPNKLKVSISSGNTVSLQSGVVTAAAEPTYDSCNGTYTGKEATVNVTNISGADAVISFTYGNLQNVNGSVTVSGGTDNNGNVSGLLGNNKSITLKFTGTDSEGVASIDLSEFNISEIKSVNLTVKVPTNGSYTANGTAVTADTTVVISNSTKVPLVATAAANYSFAGWYNEKTGKYISFNTSVELMFEEDTTIVPKFVHQSDAVFGINDAAFASLDDALAAATNGCVIRPLKDVTLEKDYTIPAGITLLVPFDKEGTCLTDTTVNYTTNTTSKINRAVYCTLTLEDDVTLTVNGALSVSAKHRSSTGGKSYGGTVEGNYGVLMLNGSSKVNVESGGVLYAYGFVLGTGSVEAMSGGTVYEIMQLAENLGGSNLLSGISQHQSHKFFLFSQYYVQNIEADLKINAGANLKVFGTMTISSETMSIPMTFIGEGGMFALGSGAYAVKSYNAASDRMTIDTYGDISLSGISMKLTGLPLVGSADINSADFYLPVNSNITVNINTGMATVNQDLTLLPGCEINIGQAAKVYVPASTQINLYDQDDWGKFTFPVSEDGCLPVSYIGSTGKASTRTITGDAVLNINGILANAGGIYTSPAGAKITSTEGSGIFLNMADAPNKTTTVYGRNNAGTSSSDWVAITFNPARLTNDNGSYLETKDSKANTGFVFDKTAGKWKNGDAIVTFDPNGAQGNAYTLTVSFANILQNQNNSATIPPASSVGFTNDTAFLGWNTKPDGTGTSYAAGQTLTVVESITLYAQWEKKTSIEITWVVKGESTTEEVEVGTIPFFKGETPTKDSDDTYHYTFAGWKSSVDEQVYTTLPAVTANVTYTAVFTAEAHADTDKQAEDGKHKCDACGYIVYSCTNANEDQDHVCDYGCGRVLSNCSDKTGDGDHKCDICGKADVTVHTYGNATCDNPATCSECNATTGTALGHVDANTDHKCDRNCGKTNMGTHADSATDNDHVCDYGCKAVLEDCSDKTGDADHKCDICGKDNVSVHTGKAPVQENVVTATCTTAGKYDSVVYCSECNAEISRTNVPGEIDPNNHDWNDPTYTWSDNGKECTAERTCKRDGSHKETETVTDDTGVVTTDPTCTTMGVTTYTANFTAAWAETQTTTREDIAARGHDWVITYTWSEDVTRCTAKRVCKRNSAHEEFETATASGEVTTPATCTEKGTTTYTANFDAEWAVDGQTTTRQNVAVIPHSYTVKQSETKATCMATGTIIWKCSECTATTTETLLIDPANHTEKNTYVEDYSAPTCGADGYTGDTYCECGVKIVTGTTIPATGNHNYATEIARTAATCMAEGSVTMQCVCGATKVTTLVINKNNHTGQGITYRNNGANHDMICECGEVYYPGQAHSYNAAHTCVCGATNHTHDHYETDETTHQSICSCGAAIGTPEGHVIVQVSPGTCQYSARNKCEICEKSFTGEKDMNNHVTTSTNYTNITDTHHTIVHACCQAVIETVPHNKDKYAFEGNCQNSARYQCSCEKEYFGVKNPNVHAAGNTIRYKDIEGATHTVYHPCCQEVIETVAHTFVRVENTNKYACVCGAEEEIALPEVEVIDIKNSLTNDDPDLTFALNFAIKDLANLDEAYLEKVLEIYGDYYTDYVLTIEGLTDASVTFNANGGADGYLAGQYDAWSENWVSVPFDDVTIMNGESLYIMEYAASMMGQSGLRFTLAEIAEIVQNFDCGVYFTPEFLNANPNLKVTLELKIFTEDAEGNKTDDISVATRTFELGNVAAIVVADGKQTEYYASLTAAYNGAEAGDTIVMLKDATLTSKLIVAKDITIDGNGHSIIANHTAFILEISSDCEFKNITLNTNNKAKGVKIASGNVVFDNVTIPNSNKSDALTVQGTLLIKNYFSVASTYSIMDASRGVVTVAPGTVFDIENWRATASPAKCDLKNALNTSGESFFTAYSSTTYYQNITSSTPLSLNGLTLLKDVTLNFNKTLTGTTTINLNGNDLTVADGKVFTVNGSLVFNGQGNVNGNFVLATESATIVAPAGLDVTTTVGCRKVVYENGVYSTAINHTPGAPADCMNDQTCTECGEVLDTAKGHTPGAPADCENNQTCTECGEVLDTAKGHNWQLDGYTNKGENHSVNYVCANDASHTYSDNGIAHNYIYNPTSNQYVCVCGAVDVVELPDVIVTDIKNSLTNNDPDLTFALNFAIKDLANLDEAYLEKVLEIYGDYYTDYVLTVSGLNDADVTFNANGGADGYLAGQYDAWSENWLAVPFDDVTLRNGESLYIMAYAAELMGKQGLRFTLAEIATIVQDFDCGVYFTPEFLASNPGLKVTLELKIFTEDANGNKVEDIRVAINEFDLGNIAAIVTADGKQTEYYASLTDAYNGAEAGDTIVMLKDATLNGKLTVAKNITIDGNGHSIIANHTAFILEISSDCEFKNITLNTNNKAKGVKIASGNVVFDNVTIPNSNKSDALTVYGTLLIKNYFSVATTYTLLDARQGVVNVAPGTVFDIANWRANASPAKCDLKSALNTNGEPFFCGYNSTTYLTSITSTTSLNSLTLLKDVTLNFNKTLTGTTTINLNGNDLTVADGKAFTVNGSLVLNGEGTVVGQLILGNANATITSSATLNVASGVANYEVKYENGVYSLVMKSGWNNIDGEWYYVINGELATGITRVPYNTELGHGPNADDKASWESNPNSAYTDAETAMYVFDQNGKLVRMTGIVNDNGTTRYAVDGVIGWHVGFVKVDNDYYYFAGDKTGGGNLIKTGKVYATRDYNTGKPVGGNCIYFFAEDGKLLQNVGVATVNGTIYYFDSYNKLSFGNGIIEYQGGYIYVRSNGELAVGKYWVSKNDTVDKTGGVLKGNKAYDFGTDGILTIDPTVNGFVTIGSDKYYYVEGEPYYAGLVEINGNMYYINSQGKVITGWYYVTKTNGYNFGTTKLYFNEDGILQNVKNGIVEENNGFYYYENNSLVYAGLVELDDGSIIYVRSNGQLATGEYWPTKRNGILPSGSYDFGEDGRYYAD